MSAEFPQKPALSDFTLGASVGAGALCSVRAATHVATGRPYALKAVCKARLRRLFARSPTAPHLLLQEKRVGELVGDAMGARLHATFQDESSVYFVYDLVGGGELWEACMESTWAGGEEAPRHPSPLAAPLAAAVVRALVRLLDALHGFGVAHRDLKPENVLLRRAEGCGGGGGGAAAAAATLRGPFSLALIDWATAKAISPPSPHNLPSECVGTPEFMAPEAADNAGAGRRAPTDARADLWSLGCVAHRLLCGVPPFPAPSPFLSTLAALAHEAPDNCSGGVAVGGGGSGGGSGGGGGGGGVDGLLFAPGTPPAAEDFLRALLRREPAARLGAGATPPVFALRAEALLAHPWLAGAADAAGGALVPSLRHCALRCAAAHVGSAPHVRFEQLREAMRAGGGGDDGGAAPSWWRAAWASVRALRTGTRLELLHLLALRRRASLPHVFSLFCDSLGHARLSRAVAFAAGGALQRLGSVGPREALSWCCAPEAVVRAGGEAREYGSCGGERAGGGEEGWDRVRGDRGGAEAPAEDPLLVVLSLAGAGAALLLGGAVGALNALRPRPRALVLLGGPGAGDALADVEGALEALSAPACAVFLCGAAPLGGAAFAPRGAAGGAAAAEEGWGAWVGGTRLLFSPAPGAHPWVAAELALAAATARHTLLVVGGEGGGASAVAAAAAAAAAAADGSARAVVAPAARAAPPAEDAHGAQWAGGKGPTALLDVPPLAACRCGGAWWLPTLRGAATGGSGGLETRWARVPDGVEEVFL